MKASLRALITLQIAFYLVASLFGIATASASNPVTIGDARFTVITPECIRMEYSPEHRFVNNPTLFAMERNARDKKAQIVLSHDRLVIRTPNFELTYAPDGKPFSPDNLRVRIFNNGEPETWSPGEKDPNNLGGPIATLDGVSSPLDLPAGLISRSGWGLVDDSGQPILRNGWIAPRPGFEKGIPSPQELSGKDIDWYLFAYGKDYQGALRSLAAISGRAAMPRREVLGSWYCRWYNYTGKQFEQIVNGYKKHDFPLDILVMDMGWHLQNATAGMGWANNLGWTGYTWNRNLIPHPKQLLKTFHKDDIFVTLNDHPADGIRTTEECYPKFMRLMGLSPTSGENLPFDDGSRRYMKAFFAASHTPLEKEGVDFWWLDWQQDSLIPWVPGVPGLRNLPWLNKLYYDHSEESGLRGQIYSRWGGWGEQRYPIQFSGDAGGFWSLLGFEVPFTLASGNDGCFYWAHDTGAIWGPRNPELYARWTQFSGFSAALRVHSMGDIDRRPWLWGEPFVSSMRRIYHLRSRLFPYIYTSVRECYDKTIPLLRPMYMMYPKENQAYHYPYEYLFGDNILVAPIITQGVGPGMVANQGVWFPKGVWYDMFTGERYEGETEKLVSADIMESPVFVRGGVPIPMQPYTPRMTTTPIRTLIVRCYPGENGITKRSSLYEDDGRTQGYLHGRYARTPLSYSRMGDKVVVRIGATSGHYAGQMKMRGDIVELPDTARGMFARINNRFSPLIYNPIDHMNRVIVPAHPITKPTTVVVYCRPVNFTLLHDMAVSRRLQGVMGKTVPSANPLQTLQSSKNLTDEQKRAILGILGVGLIKETDGRDFQSNQPRYVFYSPKGLIDDNLVHVSNGSDVGEEVSVANGAALVGGQGATIPVPVVSFKIDGEPFELSGGPFIGPGDVALQAQVTASGSEEGYSPHGAIDGVINGYPNNKANEWSSGSKTGAWLELRWNTPQTVDRIELWDRPNLTDQVTGGVITFSDGSALDVGKLPNDGQTGVTLKFPPKTITWLKFTITSVSPSTQNSGISEIAVYKADTNK